MSEVSGAIPYLLGLDIGANSVGWAVIRLSKAEPEGQAVKIERVGTRVFEAGVTGDIERGKDEPRGVTRRLKRQARRQSARRAFRIGKVFRVLQSMGLLPPAPCPMPQDRHDLILRLDEQLRQEFNRGADHRGQQLLAYRLRALAAEPGVQLPDHALGRAIYHLAQRRGFWSNRIDQLEESDGALTKAQKDELGEVHAGIQTLEQEITKAGARTLGAYFASLDPLHQRIRVRWTSRQMYKDEFDAIWAAQASHHPEWTPRVRRRIYNAIFFQRPLRSQKGLIRKCELEPRCRRAPVALEIAQRFRLLQVVNNLRIRMGDKEALFDQDPIRPLTTDERERLIQALSEQGDLKFTKIKALLKLHKDCRFNLEEGGETRLCGNRTGSKIRQILPDRWDAMPQALRDQIIHDMLNYEDSAALARKAVRYWGLTEEQAQAMARIRLEPGYSAYSRRALERLVPRLLEGLPLATALQDEYPGQRRPLAELLAPVGKALPALRNPIVERSLTETRKVVNALIRRYGKPTLIRIELARDVKQPRPLRQKASQRNRERETERARVRARITEKTGMTRISRHDENKWLLADECNWKCPYTGLPITPQTLLGTSPQFDVEHILPLSLSLDDSLGNKTLCHHEENRHRKGQKTPWQAYGSMPEKWAQILERVKAFKSESARAKLERFCAREFEEGFTTRHLNDTRYASRLAAEYLALLYGGRSDDNGRLRVQVSTGAVTAYLRDEWCLNSLLGDGGEKTRDDHRHHCVDALTIGLCGPAQVKALADAASRAPIKSDGRRYRRFAPMDMPWEGFLDEARKAVESVVTSHRVDRRVAGALHEETNHSPPKPGRDGKVYHHVRKPLSQLSKDELQEIVDPTIRRIVLEKLAGNDPKEFFADPVNHPSLPAADGRMIPIHRARVRKVRSLAQVGQGGAAQYVAPGSNHHMVVLEDTSDTKSRGKWEAVIVTRLEAAQRVVRFRQEADREGRHPQPIIQRQWGPEKRFLFSLAPGECVEMTLEGQPRAVYRVSGISATEIEFKHANDARPATVLRKVPGARIRSTPSVLRKLNCRKCTISPLGDVHPSHD